MLNLAYALRLADRRVKLCSQSPICPMCGTEQVQLVEWIELPIKWRCRYCGHLWRTTMSNCNDCRFANWTEGRCRWKMPEIPLPTAYFYPGRSGHSQIPPPSGGTIRKDMPFNHCPCWREAT
jgi:hypothetical protein